MRAHVIENGKVVNTIVVDSLDFMPNLVDGEIGGIGWDYVDGVFWPPSPFPSWVKSTITDHVGGWAAPIPRPEDGAYQWDEATTSWVLSQTLE